LQISKLREDIQKLQASEAEIKALSFNYAAMLKEKEVCLLLRSLCFSLFYTSACQTVVTGYIVFNAKIRLNYFSTS
jgi:hypothetical protein